MVDAWQEIMIGILVITVNILIIWMIRLEKDVRNLKRSIQDHLENHNK
jgi:hypothetical protein